MTTGSSSLTLTIGGGDVFVPSDFEAMRSAQMSRFGSLVILLGCIFMGLLLGLTEYTSYADDPDRQVNQYYQYLVHVNIMVRETEIQLALQQQLLAVVTLSLSLRYLSDSAFS